MAGRKEINVDITAKDAASKPLEKVADLAEKVDKSDPTVDVDADTRTAEREIRDLGETVDKVTDEDRKIVLKAQIDAARAELKTLDGSLRDTGETAEDTARKIDKIGSSDGPRLAGNQVADLTGPFGDASSAASDFGGVFDGLADIGEKVAGKIGVDAAAMASAISGVGFAVAAGAALWTVFSQKQEAAKQKAKELLQRQREFNDALREGSTVKAAELFVESYGELITNATAAGVSVKTVTDYIRGQGDAVAQLDELTSKMTDTQVIGNEVHSETVDKLIAARDAYAANTETINAQTTAQGYLEQALGKTATKQQTLTTKVQGTTDAFNDLRDAVNFERDANAMQTALEEALKTVQKEGKLSADQIADIKNQIIAVGETAGRSPIQVKTELDKVDQGDLFAVAADIQYWYKINPVLIATALQQPPRKFNPVPGQPSPDGERSAATATASSTVVNVNLPVGARGVDVQRQIVGHTRRAGRRYGSPGVTVARR